MRQGLKCDGKGVLARVGLAPCCGALWSMIKCETVLECLARVGVAPCCGSFVRLELIVRERECWRDWS